MDFWFVPLLGLFFVGAGGYFVRNGLRLRRTPDPVGWVVVPGTIVSWESLPSRFGGDHELRDLRYPVVEYPLPDGSTGRFRNATTQEPTVFRRGVPVDVLVDPEEPTRAQLVETGETWRTIGRVHVLLGIVLVVVGTLTVAGVVAAWWAFLR